MTHSVGREVCCPTTPYLPNMSQRGGRQATGVQKWVAMRTAVVPLPKLWPHSPHVPVIILVLPESLHEGSSSTAHCHGQPPLGGFSSHTYSPIVCDGRARALNTKGTCPKVWGRGRTAGGGEPRMGGAPGGGPTPGLQAAQGPPKRVLKVLYMRPYAKYRIPRRHVLDVLETSRHVSTKKGPQDTSWTS